MGPQSKPPKGNKNMSENNFACWNFPSCVLLWRGWEECVKKRKRVLFGPPLIFQRKEEHEKRKRGEVHTSLAPFLSFAGINNSTGCEGRYEWLLNAGQPQIENSSMKQEGLHKATSITKGPVCHRFCSLLGLHLQHKRSCYIVKTDQGGRRKIERPTTRKSI